MSALSTLRRGTPAILALAVAGAAACGSASDSGPGGDAALSGLATSPQSAASPDGAPGPRGCPLSVDQIAELTGAAVQGGDVPAAPETLACSFYFNLEGRPAVLTGVPLPSALRRLDRLNATAGAQTSALPALGPGAFRYVRSDPTSEAGLAYEATALLTGSDRHLTYKLSILLPSRDPAVDLSPLISKLAALVSGLDRTNPIRPRNAH